MADKSLNKAEKREQRTLKDQYRAEHNHGIALSNVRKGQRELEVNILFF
jgi:Tfp pilus assembly protein PilO